MIQLAEEVSYLDTRKVPLDPRQKRVFVEVASDRQIDLAVVDAEQLKQFDESSTGDDVDIDWTEYVRSYEFEYEFPDRKKRYLLFWNANDRDDAVIAYKITPLE